MLGSKKLARQTYRDDNQPGMLLDRVPRAILAVTTLTSASSAALKRAAIWARGFNVKLYVQYVMEPQLRSHRLFPQRHLTQIFEHSLTTEVLQERIQRWVVQLGEPPLPLEQILVSEGNLSEQIAAASQTTDVDFIVLGLPQVGDPGHRNELTPHTVRQIVRMSERPVLVARSAAPAIHILAATDLSDPAYPVLHYATRLANRVGANLTFLHPFDSAKDSLLALPFGGMLPSWPPATVSLRASAAWSQLFRLALHFGAETATVVTEPGDASSKILAEASTRHVDMIVIGAHKKGMLPGWLQASLEVEVMKQAAASVMVVPLDHN